jgi:glycosyltransferase XagB
MKSHFKKYFFYLVALLGCFVVGGVIGTTIADRIVTQTWNLENILQLFFILLSSFLTLHGVFTLVWMLYAWEDPVDAKKHKSPEVFIDPYYSFTALLPVRHEEKVVADTLKAINSILYPEYLKEVIVLCRFDDIQTIEKVKETIALLGNPRIHLEIFVDDPINKPHALNKGLYVAKNQIVAVFDAEDEPHADIYNIVNTLLVTERADVVQSGVALMNYKSHWFSALNCMEYYFWFKSGLHFFSRLGKATPLGGNTVFFKRDYLHLVGGWDENCLTEDADIGFRLIQAGAKIHVVYDEKHVTREETPNTLNSFIKQRTRWNQGFLQIFFKFNWMNLPKIRQQVVSLYILLSPLMQAILFLYIPIAIYFAITIKLPIVVALFSFLPLFLFFLQIIALIIGLYEFTKSYNLRFPVLMPIRILIYFYPYLFILALSSVRAMWRLFLGYTLWEKTTHINAHRQVSGVSFAKAEVAPASQM